MYPGSFTSLLLLPRISVPCLPPKVPYQLWRKHWAMAKAKHVIPKVIYFFCASHVCTHYKYVASVKGPILKYSIRITRHNINCTVRSICSCIHFSFSQQIVTVLCAKHGNTNINKLHTRYFSSESLWSWWAVDYAEMMLRKKFGPHNNLRFFS